MIYQKRGMWKVAGSARKYNTEAEALANDPDAPVLCKECGLEDCDCCTLCNKYICECIEDGNIEEGHNDGEGGEEGGLSESTDRSLPRSSWHRTHSKSDSSD